MPIKCEIDVEYKDKFGYIAGHEKCGKKAKYKITFMDGILKRIVTYNMCGIHKVAFVKNSARNKKFSSYDSGAEIIEINE